MAALHDVGNVVTTLNVCAREVRESIRQLAVPQWAEALVMILDTQRPERERALRYLRAGLTAMGERQLAALSDVERLADRIEHVARIVTMPQTPARPRALTAPEDLGGLVREALAIHRDALDFHQIVVEERYGFEGELVTDRHTVLQILVNLIRNARDSFELRPAGARALLIETEQLPDAVAISVRDISPDVGCGATFTLTLPHLPRQDDPRARP